MKYTKRIEKAFNMFDAIILSNHDEKQNRVLKIIKKDLETAISEETDFIVRVGCDLYGNVQKEQLKQVIENIAKENRQEELKIVTYDQEELDEWLNSKI